MIPNIVNKSQAMKIFGIGSTKRLKLLKEPDCPAIKVGKGWLINIDEIWPWLMERKKRALAHQNMDLTKIQIIDWYPKKRKPIILRIHGQRSLITT